MNRFETVAELVLADNAEMLWNSVCQRELLRLLRNAEQVFGNPESLRSLVDAILKGPPTKYLNKVPDERIEEYRARRILHRLVKLEKSAISLPDDIVEKIESLKDRNPDYQLADHEDYQDEFPAYMSTSWVSTESDLAAEEINQKSDADWEEYALSPSEWDDKWISYCKKLPFKAFTKLLTLGNNKQEWPSDRWISALYALKSFFQEQIEANNQDVNRYFYLKICSTLQTLPDDLIQSEGFTLEAANFLGSYPDICPQSDGLYWQLWKLIWNASDNSPSIRGGCLRTQALNSAPGQLAQQLIEWLSDINTSESIQLVDLVKKHTEIILDDNSKRGLLGRIRLFTDLSYLYYIDPKWVQEKFFCLLDKANNNSEWMQLWYAFMLSPKVSPNLFHEIKASVTLLIQNHIEDYSRLFDDDDLFESSRLVQWLGHLFIPEDSYFTRDQAKSIVISLDEPRYLVEIVTALKNRIEGTPDDNAKNLWRQQVRPWFVHVWPKSNLAKASSVSSALAKMSMYTGSAFPDCVETIYEYLSKIDDDNRMILYSLSESSNNSNFSYLVRDYPESCLRLLDKLFKGKPILYSDFLIKILDNIERHDTRMSRRDDFKNLRILAGK